MTEHGLPLRATLSWLQPSPADSCTCHSCNLAHACHCAGWAREVTTLIAPSTAAPHTPVAMVFVREHHSLDCPQAIDPALGAHRVDLMPRQRGAGPLNRFDPVSAQAALCLNTSPWVDRTWLYRAFDDSGELLYVGITGDVAGRMRAHRRKSRWWLQFDYLELTVFRERFEARAAERRAIRIELPRFNDAD